MKILAAKISLTISILSVSNVSAGMSVFDASNYSQNSVSAMESVAQTLKQIDQYTTQMQQYSTQLDQYQNMLQNTATPPTYIWNKASNTMTKMRNTMNTLSYYKSKLGGIDTYLNKSQNSNYYKNSACYKSGGCSYDELANLDRNQQTLADSQKSANDSLIRTLDTQQSALDEDAQQLEQLQSNAQTADGQMKALSYANQLASQQNNQLLQMRGLLVAQQNAIAQKYQADLDAKGREEADRQYVRRDPIKRKPLVQITSDTGRF